MVAILDQSGNPIKREAIQEPQSARLATLHREFAEHPSRGLTPSKIARILDDAERGNLQAQCDLFEDMEEKDGHIMAEMGKRKRALLGLDWTIEPPRNATAQEERAAGLVQEILIDLPDFEDLVFDLLDGIGKGFSNSEIEWQRLGREWVPKEITYRPQRWFQIPDDNRNEIRLRNNTATGEALQPFGWILHVHKAKSGYVARSGLHRALAWPYLFKNYSVRDLAEFLEIYGLPLRLGTYPPGASNKEKSTLLRAVVNIGHSAAGIVPEGMLIDFKEAAKGTKDPFEAMIAWCERTQSKAILGGTLTSQADGKSSTNALGNVHNEVRWDLTVSDCRQLAGTLTRCLVYPIAALNVGGIEGLRRAPRFVFDTSEAEDIAVYAEALPNLVDVGLRIPETWARNKLNIPEPEDEEAVLQRSAQPTAAARHHAGCPHCGTAALKSTPNDPSAVDKQTEQLDDALVEPIEGLFDSIREVLDDVDSLEEFRDRLLELYPELVPGEIVSVMQQAMAAADLAGRFDSTEDRDEIG